MSLQVEKLEKNMAKLTIEVSADDLEKALQNAYMKQKKQDRPSGIPQGKSSASDDRENVRCRDLL